MSTAAPLAKLPKPYRRVLLTLHVISSVGWLGLSLANISLAVTVTTTSDPVIQHASFRVLELVGTTVILPISLTAFVTGVLASLGTQWGLLRYRWVLIKFALTLVAVLLTFLSLLPGLHAATALVDATAPDRLADVDSSGLLSAAFVSTSMYTFSVVLSIFKPWGRTRWGVKALAGDRPRAAARA